MRRLFVEMPPFERRINRARPETLASIQNELLERLEAGDVIEGTGGLRKLRVADPGRGKGKRGGFRVIYLDLPHAGRTYLVALYDKNEKIDISADEKRILRALAAQLKQEV
ncbi:MAG: type II toxin-antitoxin system RelE/ParE family toxin [Elusimicrobia bacterium]|nr:type II toxin-antitoxin system RelE/ParE family toxin [Elusimicrobiota bacterium]MDE2424830.1 type II toxin-antitoxin system RelE/ParE family toxin [Elusimicrobiota bacterium]